MTAESPKAPSLKEHTLYLIRHGEASHNVLEKEAKRKAKEAAIAEGYGPDSEETLLLMEKARKAVLDDDNLADCELSDAGREEAATARDRLNDLLKENGLPAPTEVFVSPLTRALQTADAVFPRHSNIRVRDELKERQTGKACDTRSPSAHLVRRKTFSRFSMVQFRLGSIRKLDLPFFGEIFGSSGEIDEDEDLPDGVVEEKHMLRERTKKLLKILAESAGDATAVVSHKGYFRELERGVLGQPLANEFQNCEVRVYRLKMSDSALVEAKRIV